MIGLRLSGWIALSAIACGPAVATDEPPGETSGTTSGTVASSTGPVGPSASSGSDAPGTSASPTTAATATLTGPSGGDTQDSSHDTEYPVDPSCDEGDESYGEYPGESTSGNSSGAEGTSVGMGGDIPLGTTVFALQTGGVLGGDFVEITDVVVTAPPVPGPNGLHTLLYVQEPAGGANSGIGLRIFDDDGTIDTLLPGDRVTVRGLFIERYVFATVDVPDATLMIDIGTPGPLPEPVVVTPEMISAGGTLAQTLESVLVQVEDVQVIDPVVCPGEVELEATLRIDDRYLAQRGEEIPPSETGYYSTIRGPLIYTYNGFEVAPRSLDDVAF